MATVTPKDDFDAEDAAKTLKDAMKGVGNDEDAIIQVMSEHDNEQRQEIKSTYKSSFGEELEDKLSSALHGSFKHCVLSLMATPRVFDARELRSAMKGVGTDDTVLIEILTPRTNEMVEGIKEAYEAEHERDLEKDLESASSGDFKRLLVSLASAGRDESDDVDMDQAKQDAQDIYDAGEGQFGTDESVFNNVLCTRSVSHLRATFAAYNVVAGNDIEDGIKSECRGSLQDGYLCIVRCAKLLPSFFAERMKKAMSGLGTDEDLLTRTIVSRSEIDLADVKEIYPSLYDKTLAEAVSSDCRGDSKKMLLALLGESE